MAGFAAMRKSPFKWVHCVERGVWRRGALAKIKQLGFYHDVKRPMMSNSEHLGYLWRRFKQKVYLFVPAKVRSKLIKGQF